METSSRTGMTFSVVLLLIVTFFLVAEARKTSSSSQDKRVFENKIPAQVPIKIKIKKEKVESFEDLKNEKWLSACELELTNQSDKPIYFIEIMMVSDVNVKESDMPYVFPIYYGRPELGDIVSKATSADIPIKPGDTYILKMGPVDGWEKIVREGRVPQARKLTAKLQIISFGDGTGYFANEPYPTPKKQSSRLLDGSDRPKGDLNIPGLT